MEFETTIYRTVERLRATCFNIEPNKNVVLYLQINWMIMALEWKHAEGLFSTGRSVFGVKNLNAQGIASSVPV